MPIILAIEPDRRQRDALTAVVRQRVGAELILADTTERALEAIGNRVPDLVLVPALLSPTDDAALAAALRVIAAAAHVRTLTIPVLASHTQAAPSSGLLSRWRRGRTAPQAPDGCDPAVFAEQIVAYLKEGAAERAQRIDDEEHDQSVRQDVGPPESQPPDFALEFGLDDFRSSDTYVQADAQDDVQAAAETYVPAEPPVDLQDPVEPDPVVASLEQYPAAASFNQYQAAASPEQHPVAVIYEPYAVADAPEHYPVAPALEQYPVGAYTPTDSHPHVAADAQPDVQAFVESDVDIYVQPESQVYLQDPAETTLEHYAVSDTQPDEQPQADVQNEVLDLVEGDEYDTQYAGSDALSTLEIEQEEDIDLSSELDELEADEPRGMRAEASETELFDGEPIGVYTMPSLIDEPEVDVAVLEARQAFAEAEVDIEPALTAEASAETESEVEAAVDPEFFADAFEESEYETELPTERELDTQASVDSEFYADSFAETALDEETRTEPEAAVARAFDAETTGASDEYDDFNAEDAEPEPADAEPWASAFLSPRWMWPAMEGVPTEQPAVQVAVEAVAVAAAPAAVAEPRPAPVPHKRPEWSELVASLRKDIERRRVEPPQAKPKVPAAAEAAAVQAPRRSKKAKPIQDEWGFFDPEQCGFAALLAKLDEITETPEDAPVQQSSAHQSS